ncbi:unnamed protein product [Caenorhabditis sp. 36 PRJEB53466]|nr:unnamed protein product [Caenorhabditis sp. 36 PRJEB53466]
MNREIKRETMEPEDEHNNDPFVEYTFDTGPTSRISPNHPDLRTDNLAETLAAVHNHRHDHHHHHNHMHQKLDPSHHHNHHSQDDSSVDIKPTWYPSAKGRSIVWEHITWVAETQRASCNYCQAEFQIKGGTSALLRHLKTIHPAAINFDPDNPPPVVRRNKRKKLEDYTIVTEDTKSYMDNLLEQFLHDENVPRADPQPCSSAQVHVPSQSRADSEIDEVIRSLQKETAQNGGEEREQDTDLRRLLGIDDEPPVKEEVIAGTSSALEEPPTQRETSIILQTASTTTTTTTIGGVGGGHAADEDKQVSSSSGQSAKKRKAEDPKDFSGAANVPDNYKHGKFSLSLMSSMRRPTPHPIGQQPVIAVSAHLPPPPPATLVAPPTSSTIAGPSTSAGPASAPTIPAKFSSAAVACLDFEAKVLYNQSMHSTIAREDAMAAYYRMKSRKLELEIKKLERELGEGSRATSPDEHDE